MAGNEHIPTAPKDTIGDDGDLRTMRDALRAGKNVTLGHDGKVYVSAEAVTPMTEAQESFVESKLGHVIELARSGYGVSVKPDGTIFADRADHLSKVMYDPDPALSDQQRGLVQLGISQGAHVQVHADGRVEYFLARDAVAPHPDQVARLQAAFDDQVSSGRLLTEMGAGRSLSANPDGSLDYRNVAPGPDPVLFPEDPVVLDTVAELEAEAEALDLGAGAARVGGLEDFFHAERAANTGRDAAGRLRAASEGAADEAKRQVDDARQRGEVMAKAEIDAWRKADVARAAGDTAAAQEATEAAQAFAAMKVNARLAEEAANSALQTHRETAGRHSAEEQRFEEAGVAARHRAKQLEDVFDAQEDQAREYRTAAAELREAERLEEALVDLEARGVPGSERVREAAAQHRRLAEEAIKRGNDYDDAAPASPPSTPPPAGRPVSLEVGEEVGPVDIAAAELPGIEMPEIEMPEIEMPEIELPEVEMPAASFGESDVSGIGMASTEVAMADDVAEPPADEPWSL